MAFAGVMPPSVLRGLALSCVATSNSRAGECTDTLRACAFVAATAILSGIDGNDCARRDTEWVRT